MKKLCNVCLVVGTRRTETTKIGKYNYCKEHEDHVKMRIIK